MIDYYLGVDGGGTKTQAVLIDSEEEVTGRGQAGGSNPAVFGIKKSLDNIYSSIQVALKNFPDAFGIPACLAIAGVNTQEQKDQFTKAIKSHWVLAKLLPRNLLIVNDTQAALRSGTTKANAIVVIAGTGSNCWGRNEQGRQAKSGGVDYILSDEGSAFSIGSAILHAVTRQLDGRGEKTLLTKLLFDKYKIRTLSELVLLIYQNQWGKVEIAEVAGLCEIAAQKGDRVAQKIIEDAANELAHMAIAVAKKLEFAKKPYVLVKSGSVFKMKVILNSRFDQIVRKFNPNVEIVKPKIDSAKAAALLALETHSP